MSPRTTDSLLAVVRPPVVVRDAHPGMRTSCRERGLRPSEPSRRSRAPGTRGFASIPSSGREQRDVFRQLLAAPSRPPPTRHGTGRADDTHVGIAFSVAGSYRDLDLHVPQRLLDLAGELARVDDLLAVSPSFTTTPGACGRPARRRGDPERRRGLRRLVLLPVCRQTKVDAISPPIVEALQSNFASLGSVARWRR